MDSDGDHQCGTGGGVGFSSAADQAGAHDEQLEDGVLRCGRCGAGLVAWWYASYRESNDVSVVTLDARLVARELSFSDIVRMRRVQVLVFAKFMSDSAWYFNLFWLPKYLYDVRGFDVKHVSYYAWIPYAASGLGSFLGGWLSSAVVDRTKKLACRKMATNSSGAVLRISRSNIITQRFPDCGSLRGVRK